MQHGAEDLNQYDSNPLNMHAAGRKKVLHKSNPALIPKILRFQTKNATKARNSKDMTQEKYSFFGKYARQQNLNQEIASGPESNNRRRNI